MIVLGEKRENLNIVHLIMGPETEFQFDMSGQCIIDITEHHKHTNSDDHMILVLNRCQSEEMLAGKLKELNENIKESSENNCECNKEEKSHSQQKPQSKQEVHNSQQINFKCPLCLEDYKGIYKNGIVHPCTTCQKINEGIVKHNVPEAPSKEQLKTIIEEMMKKTPKEFKLLIQKIFADNKRKAKTNAS